MKIDSLGIDVEPIPLGYGLVAYVMSGPEDRPALPKANPAQHPRRDPDTGHLWEVHDCPDCAKRRHAATQLLLSGMNL